MGLPLFIGDELSVAGFRLAGFRTEIPSPGEEAACLRRACDQSDLVLITAEVAARVPEPELKEWQAAPRPLLLVVPDARGRLPAPDLGLGLRHQLGLLE